MKVVHLLVTVKLEEGFTQGDLLNDVKNAVQSYPGSLRPEEAIEGMRKATVKLLNHTSTDNSSSGKKRQHFSTK